MQKENSFTIGLRAFTQIIHRMLPLVWPLSDLTDNFLIFRCKKKKKYNLSLRNHSEIERGSQEQRDRVGCGYRGIALSAY